MIARLDPVTRFLRLIEQGEGFFRLPYQTPFGIKRAVPWLPVLLTEIPSVMRHI